MGAKTDHLENKLTDLYWRGQTYTPPGTHYIGLIVATRGYSSAIRSAAVAPSFAAGSLTVQEDN